MNMLINEKLDEYKKRNRISFAMPGHKSRGAQTICDVTELEDTIDLINGSAATENSLNMLSSFYGSDFSLYLTNGSTGGVLTMVFAAFNRGDTVVIGRGAHRSVYNACRLAGLKTIIIRERTDREFSIPHPLSPEDIKIAYRNNPEINGVILTSPTYYGEAANIRVIADIVHAHDGVLLVDEAHGAHFAACNVFPWPSIQSGADMSVNSAHKTLGALTPSAFLHMRGERIDLKRVKDVYKMLNTSSPPSYLCASMEKAVREIIEDGGEAWRATVQLCREVPAKLEGTDIKLYSPLLHDATRLVMNFSNYSISGYEVADALREKYNIDVEMADEYNIVCIVTPYNTAEELSRLCRAVCEASGAAKRKKKSDKEKAAHKIFIADYSEEPDSIAADFYKSEGRVAATDICIYPPGTPVICAGETVTAKVIARVAEAEEQKAKITGKESFRVYI